MTHVRGDAAWQTAKQRTRVERRAVIERFGREWVDAVDNRVAEDNSARLATVARVFGTRGVFAAAGKGEVTEGLMSIRAFTEQLRFVKGGYAELAGEFRTVNGGDVLRVRNTLGHLFHGPGSGGCTTCSTILR